MVRAVLASMVPCLAIGLTGLLVTTIGRTLLAATNIASVTAATITALVLTILIMVACAIAAGITDRSHAARTTETTRH